VRSRKLITAAALVFVLSVSLVGTACSSDDEATTTAADTSSKTVVVIATDTADTTTLAEYIVAAKLDATLSEEGPFTVMAPVNEAFAAIPSETTDALAADPTGALADVLKLHVLSGEIDSAAAKEAVGTCVETLGGPVKIDEDAEGNLTFGGAKITATDIKGSNGIIHLIDGVVTEASTDCPTS
jgi:uncharacterized surface protein with fasciclin (FAS1) repeats